MKKIISSTFLAAALLSTSIGATPISNTNLDYKNVKVTFGPEQEVFLDSIEAILVDGKSYIRLDQLVELGVFKVDVLGDAVAPFGIVSKEKENEKIEDSANGILAYLNKYYSSVQTDIGTVAITFSVSNNTDGFFPYDYRIKAEIDSTSYSALRFGDKIHTDTQIKSAKAKLKKNMESLGNDLVKKLPNRKFRGSYDHSYYKYDSIKEGYTSITYCNWSNFNSKLGDRYNNTKASSFMWEEVLDKEKW